MAIDVPDPKVDLLDPVVSVQIEIGEVRKEKNFSGVNVSTSKGGKVQPATTSVTLLGATSLIDSLKAEDLKIVLDAAGQTLEPRLELPDALKGKVVFEICSSFEICTVEIGIPTHPDESSFWY